MNIYSKTDFHGIKKFFKETKWNEFYREEVGVEEKWRMFRNIYNKGVETYVPKQRQEKVYIQEWLTEDAVRQRSEETKLGTNGKKINTLESGKYISGKEMSM